MSCQDFFASSCFIVVFFAIRGKCEKANCSFCQSKFLGRRHHHPEGWSAALHSFFEQESGLTIGNGDLCVCGACDVNIRQELKARDKGEPYQLGWLKSRRVCCVPSADIKAEKHNFSWEVICKSISIASTSTPVDCCITTRCIECNR